MVSRIGIFTLSVLFTQSAFATMPPLTPRPRTSTPAICQAWAVEQDADAIEMWGVQDDGTTSRPVALHRLADFCLGHRLPDIVGFGSSVGFDEAYCARHKSVRICHSNATILTPELNGRWADTSESCTGDRSASRNDGADYQVIDFDKDTVAFFDAEEGCPMEQFAPKAKGSGFSAYVFRVVCKGEGGDGPPFWLFISTDREQLKISRVNPGGDAAPYHYSLLRCH